MYVNYVPCTYVEIISNYFADSISKSFSPFLKICFLSILNFDILNSWKNSELSISKKVDCICSNESPLKIMTNAFCYIPNALFVLMIFKFLSLLFWLCWKTP